MKRISLILLAAAMILAGCNAGSGESAGESAGGSEATSVPVSEQTAQENQEPIELLIMTDAVDGEMAEFYDGINDLYQEAHPGTNVTLKHEAMPFNDLMGAPLQVRYASGSAPDIQLMTVEMTLTLVEAGYLQQLDEYYTEEVREDYFDGIVESVSTFDGHPYNFMLHRGLEMLAYDADVLREEGIEPPKTPQELIEAAKAVTTPDRYGLTAFIDPTDHLIMTWMPFIWGEGGDALNDTLDAGALNSPEVIRGLKSIRELSESGALNPLPSRPGNNGGIIGDGETVFQFLPFTQCGMLAKDYPERLESLEVTRYPTPEGKPFVTFGGGWALGATSMSKHPEEAKEAAFWMAVEDNSTIKKMLDVSGNMPCRRSVLEDPEVSALYDSKLYRMIMDDEEQMNGVRMAYVATSEFNKILIDLLDRTLFELETPVETIAEEQNEKMNDYISSYDGPKDGLRRQDLSLGK